MAGLFKRKHTKTSPSKSLDHPGTVGDMGKSKPSGERVISADLSNPRKLHSPWKKRRLYNSPFPRFSHAASSITSDQGGIYLMGGLSSNAVYGDMWVIEPIKNDNDPNYPYIASPIENAERVPSPRTGHASVLIGNAFIVFGGDTVIDENDQFLDNKLYFFNISSLKWTITSPEGERPQGRYGHQISVLNFELPNKPNHWLSYLYLFGGQMDSHYFDDVWKFDLSNFRNPKTKWEKIKCTGDVPPPLANHSLVAFNNKLFIFGGNNGSIVNEKMYSFDPLKNTWKILAFHGKFKPPALTEHSVTIYQNLLFIFGGKLANDELSNDLYAVDLNNMNSFKVISNLPYAPSPRCGHSISVNGNEQKIVVMGGDKYDDDFSGVKDDNNPQIEENQFSYKSSVIFEFDINKLDEFMEKASNSTSLPVISSTPLSSKSNLDLSELPDTSNVEQKQAHRLSYIKSESAEKAAPVEENVPDSARIRSTDSQFLKHEESIFNDYHDMDADDTLQKSPEVTNASDQTTTTPTTAFTNVSNDVSSRLASETTDFSKTSALDVSPVDKVELIKPSTPSFNNKQAQNGTPIVPFSPAFMDRDNDKMKQLVKMVNDVKNDLNTKVMEANNKIKSLSEENDTLKSQMGNQITFDKLTELNELIKSQQQKIETLSTRLISEDDLQRRLDQMEQKNLQLTKENENFKLVKEEIVSDSGVKSITEGLTNLLVHLDSKDKSMNDEIEAQKQVKDSKLQDLENLHKETISSLNKTYKALHLSQNELGKYREENMTLKNQIEELKITKRIYSNSSTPVINNRGTQDTEDDDDDDENDLDPLVIKLKDLEAHLYIVSQERDQLKDELLSVKKQLYNTKNV